MKLIKKKKETEKRKSSIDCCHQHRRFLYLLGNACSSLYTTSAYICSYMVYKILYKYNLVKNSAHVEK